MESFLGILDQLSRKKASKQCHLIHFQISPIDFHMLSCIIGPTQIHAWGNFHVCENLLSQQLA